MPIAKSYAAALIGIDAFLIDVEVSLYGKSAEGVPNMNIVGLPDTAVRESRDRVRSALMASGLGMPDGQILVGLAPADIRKEGAAFDLAIALTLLCANGQISTDQLEGTLIMGELSLDGTVRSVRGMLAVSDAVSALESIKRFIVPESNARECAVAARGVPVYGVKSLQQCVELLRGESDELQPVSAALDNYFSPLDHFQYDFADVKGQLKARRALEIAAAGSHNVLMIGPPGAGKSMLAKRFSSILPPLTLSEALETTKIHSSCGKLPPNMPLIQQRPFRDPHHTASDVGLIGGQNIPTPGEISLAHNGVLFLDELPEFKRNVLEVLRQPLENGSITVTRAAGSCTFPARFILLAAMNPCPCGYYGSDQRECHCGTTKIDRYRGRISGPLLDRIDIHVDVGALTEAELVNAPTGDDSATIRRRVIAARERQIARFANGPLTCNAQMEPKHIRQFCQLDTQAQMRIRYAIREYKLSARAYDRILRVARTIADLENCDNLHERHVFEAIQYRQLDKQLW